jgi:hypothetical protein
VFVNVNNMMIMVIGGNKEQGDYDKLTDLHGILLLSFFLQQLLIKLPYENSSLVLCFLVSTLMLVHCVSSE